MPQSISVVIIDSDIDDEKIFHKISPCPSLLKRGKYLPLWERGIKRDFMNNEKTVIYCHSVELKYDN
jgi:hypothetical protein